MAQYRARADGRWGAGGASRSGREALGARDNVAEDTRPISRSNVFDAREGGLVEHAVRGGDHATARPRRPCPCLPQRPTGTGRGSWGGEAELATGGHSYVTALFTSTRIVLY